MILIRDILIIVLLALGLFFFFVGSLGILRMPDVFTRMHVTTKADTMGAGLIFLAMILWKGFSFISLNILIILIFIWLTNPTACHFIAKGAYERKYGLASMIKEDDHDTA